MEDKLPIRNNSLYRFGPFVVDAAERTVHRNGQPVPLTRKVFDLLLILITSVGSLQTRESLIEALWPDSVVGEQNLATKMYALRKALGDNGKEPQYIETVRGIGYRFIADVTEATGEISAGKPTRPVRSGSPAQRKVLLASVFLVLLAAGGALSWRLLAARRHTAGSGHGHQSIAVLPFENLSADSDNAYFVSGMQDEILTRLAAIRGLKVISRTSTAQYTSHPEDLSRIARQLGVAMILEGSVQKAGDKVHVNVQLINAHTYAHIWAHSYDRELRNVFSVEGEVAQEIADALRTRLLPDETERLARPPTNDSQAYLFFLRGNYLSDQIFSRENAPTPAKTERQAVDFYHRALKLDPNFALAYARLSLLDSQAFWFATNFDSYQRERITEAEQAARKAVKLDPDLPQAHLALGYALYYGKRDYTNALIQFEEARKSLPNNADAIAAIAFIHRRQGKWEQALDELREASLLDPRNPRRMKEVGITLAVLRRYEQAEQAYTRVLALEPRDYHAMVRLARIKLLLGMPDAALKELDKIPSGVDLGGLISAFRFRAYMYERKPDKALATLKASSSWQFGVLYYKSPTDLFRARAWAFKDDRVKAREYFRHALNILQTRLRSWPDDETLWASVGIAQAGLGNKADAIKAGIRSTAILPIGKDEYYGPGYLYILARIYARTGDADRAVQLLRRLLSMPAGEYVSASSIHLDPIWDPIREHADFRALMRDYPNRPRRNILPHTKHL